MSLVVVMGVSGAGKTTVGRALADAIGARFVEGDDLHPATNVALMRSGQPITEEHRRPWLDAIAAEVAADVEAGEPVVVACSALTRAARDRLRLGGAARFVFLDAEGSELRRRVHDRQHPFMPPELLDAQIDTLEHPGEEDDVVVVEPTGDVASTVARVLAALEETRSG